jgi:hypothetical protein
MNRAKLKAKFEVLVTQGEAGGTSQSGKVASAMG